MQITRTGLEGCILLEPKVYKDERGYFAETYNKQIFDEAAGYKVSFVQDNQSFSKMGVIRALHYQVGEHAQAKLVRVLQGEVMDVAVDLRKDSPTAAFVKRLPLRTAHACGAAPFAPTGSTPRGSPTSA